MTGYQQSVFDFALSAYSFVLPYTGFFTMKYWAAMIEKVYSKNTPQNEEVIHIILLNDQKYIISRNQGNTSTIEINKGE